MPSCAQVLPRIIREEFHRDPTAAPRKLLGDPRLGGEDRVAQRLWDVGFGQIASDYLVRAGLEANDTTDEANRPLLVPQHRYAVCSEGDSRRAARRKQNSIELPHNEARRAPSFRCARCRRRCTRAGAPLRRCTRCSATR